MEQQRHSLKSVPEPRHLNTHRWFLFGGAAIGALGMMTAFALAPSDHHPATPPKLVVESIPHDNASIVDIEAHSFLREERILRTDTLSSLTRRLGITDPEALNFLSRCPEAQVISRQLRPGKAVSARTNESGELLAFYFPLNGKDATLTITKSGGRFNVTEQVQHLDRLIAIKSGEIRHSLFGATDAANIPDAIATQLAEIFAGDIDFYRDLRKGDRFSIVYEILTHQGQPMRSGRILTAEFVNNQKTHTAFWFESEPGKGGYYSAEGKSLRKAFLRSPLEFSRVTSGFSISRFHPVLQVNRAHKGIDYGAPVGTRVRAVSDGTVDFLGWQGGYGKMVVIRHQGAYSTDYGHLSGFAPSLKKGSRVNQGDTIGFTGQTGLASGPHLHYEFRVNSVQVNPQTIALPATPPLEASQVNRFKQSTELVREQLVLAKQFRGTTFE